MCRRTNTLSIDNSYVISQTLAKGSFSVCRLARCKDCGQEVAVKSISRDHQEFEQHLIEAEADVMKAISHPSCVQLFSVIEDAAHVHFVQELAPGGDLFERIFQSDVKISMTAARTIMSQLVKATRYLHVSGICHRDLKPENIMMMSRDPSAPRYNDIKIADFGLACRGVDGYSESMTEVCGTPDYCAPEMLALALAPEAPRPYSCKVDVWSLGAIMFTMLARRTPFALTSLSSKNMMRKVISIVAGETSVLFPSTPSFVPSVVQFISTCMEFSPSKRATADLLHHPFFTLHPDNSVPSLVLSGREGPTGYHEVTDAKFMGMVVQSSSCYMYGGEITAPTEDSCAPGSGGSRTQSTDSDSDIVRRASSWSMASFLLRFQPAAKLGPRMSHSTPSSPMGRATPSTSRPPCLVSAPQCA